MFEYYKQLEKDVELAKSKLRKEFDNVIRKYNINNYHQNRFSFCNEPISINTSNLYQNTKPFGLCPLCEIKENENDEYYINLLLSVNECFKLNGFYFVICTNDYIVSHNIKIYNLLFSFPRFEDESSRVQEQIKLNNLWHKNDILVKDLMEQMGGC